MKQITLPGSKSITNRDLILAALASGKSVLRWALDSDDTVYMIEALRTLWIKIYKSNDVLEVHWWIELIEWNNQNIFIWNSWTSMRFLLALAALNKKWSITLTWTPRMLKRPLKDLTDWIKQLGNNIISDNWFPPVTISSSWIFSDSIKMNWASSSQYFTAMIQIAPLLDKWLTIEVDWDLVSKPYIDITINELNKFWVEVTNNEYKSFVIKKQSYKSVNIDIEWDASALSYFVEYIIIHGWELEISNIWSNSKQWDYNFLRAVSIFGLEYNSDWEKTIIRAPGIKKIDLSRYKDLEIDFITMPDVSLTFMALSIFLPWKTKIIWLQTLNLKECDRITAMNNELSKLWVEVACTNDQIEIWELWITPKQNIQIDTYDDHRIAMVFGTLKTLIPNLVILNPECVGKTYPSFWDDMNFVTIN